MINFLKIDRMDILYEYSSKILATDFVKVEVSGSSNDQKARMERGINESRIAIITVSTASEWEIYSKLSKDESLGAGECSSIALAAIGKYTVAMDDKRAIAKAKKLAPPINVVTTKDIMVKAIQTGFLTVREADIIKADWSKHYKFRLNFESFESII